MGFFRRGAKVEPDGPREAAPKKARGARRGLFRLFKQSQSPNASSTPSQTLILLGCDNAGKTTLIARLNNNGAIGDPAPTVGFSTNAGKLGTTPLTLFDVGGGKNIRGIWDSYYADVHAAIFVVDASDSSRFSEACELLHAAYAHASLARKPLLVLANKQDLPHAVGPVELAEALRLHELSESSYQVIAGSASQDLVDGSSLHGGLSRFLQSVASSRPELQARVEREVAEREEDARRRKEERKERLRLKREARQREEEEEAAKAAAQQQTNDAAGAIAAPTAVASASGPTASAATPPDANAAAWSGAWSGATAPAAAPLQAPLQAPLVPLTLAPLKPVVAPLSLEPTSPLQSAVSAQPPTPATPPPPSSSAPHLAGSGPKGAPMGGLPPLKPIVGVGGAGAQMPPLSSIGPATGAPIGPAKPLPPPVKPLATPSRQALPSIASAP